MADEGGAAVADVGAVDTGVDTAVDTSSSVDTAVDTSIDTSQSDKVDGRRQPDALRKEIAELRRQAETITDPALKQAKLDAAKELNNKIGKVGAYEQVYPTVREAREVKSLVDSFGGREGLVKVQETLSEVEAIDNALSSGDPSVVEKLWAEAPDGMVKLAPMIFANLEKANPEAYAKAVTPHAVKFFDTAGFPEAFDQMVQMYQSGDKAKGDALAAKMAQWFSSQRSQTKEAPKVDPRVQELESKLSERETAEQKQAVDRAYSDVVNHAGPVIDRFLKPIVAKLGLTKEQYSDLREDTWKHLQDTRNADATYKTVAAAKQRQGMDAVAAYIKSETESRAQDAARKMAERRYGHQLKNGAVKTPNVTATPMAPGITRGKEPSPSEIDYSIKGIQVAKKAGFKDLSEMILSGKAPLKSGGIRQWR